MIIRKLRLEKGWSQEQLAEFSGLSVRTIQRIEHGKSAGNETLKSLAAVFNTPVATLVSECNTMNLDKTVSVEETEAIEYVRDIKGFYNHILQFIVVNSLLLVINLLTNPDYLWVVWSVLGWGVGLIIHGLNVFELFSFLGPDWEKRQIDKRLNRR